MLLLFSYLYFIAVNNRDKLTFFINEFDSIICCEYLLKLEVLAVILLTHSQI